MRMSKKLKKLLISSLAVGAVTFTPVIYNFDGSYLPRIVSVAHAEVKTYVGTGSAEFNFGEGDSEIVEKVQAFAQSRAEQAAKEQAVTYIKSTNNSLTDETSSTIANVLAEVSDIKYEKLPTENKAIKYEATITLKIDADGISNYLKLSADEREDFEDKNKVLQKLIANNDKEFEDLRKASDSAQTEEKINEITGELSDSYDKLLAIQKLDEGHHLLYQKNYTQAIDAYSQAIDLDSDSVNMAAYYSRGDAYMRLEEYYEAVDDYSEIIDDYEDEDSKAFKHELNMVKVYYNRAFAHSKLEYFEEVVDDCNKAIKLDPKFAKSYYRRARAYCDLGEFDKAIKDCNKAIKLDPNDANSYTYRGMAYMCLEDYDKSISDANKAIELDPNNEEAYLLRGLVYGGFLEEYQKAITDLDKAIEIKPNFAEAYLIRAPFHVILMNIPKAIDDLSKYIELKPDDENGYLMRGKCYKALGEEEKAQADAAKAKEIVDERTKRIEEILNANK